MTQAISSVLVILPQAEDRAQVEHVDPGPGLVIHVVADGNAGERMHARLQSDVIIADADDGRGLELLLRARHRDPDCFRVLIENAGQTELVVHNFNVGIIDAILPRPIHADALRAMVHQGCEAALLRRHNRSLLAELGARNLELIELNNRLEQTVVNRTAELTKTLEELHSAHRHLQAKQAELVRLETQGHMAQLVRGLTHELNNPLAVVLGYAQRLRRTLTEPDLARRIDVIITEASRLSGLVERLRSFAQPLEEDRQSCDVVEAVKAAVEQHVSENKVVLQVRAAADVPKVQAAPRALARVIGAVLRNAHEASCSAIMVSGETVFGRVRVMIGDDGETPTVDQCRNAMRPFFTTRAGSGHQGLGLSLASGLLMEMDGTIELRPRAHPDGGAEVLISLPEPIHGNERRVLVVDDEPLLRELITDSLSEEGYQVTTVSSLSEARAMVAAQSFHALIVDRHLPDGDGASWAKELVTHHGLGERILLMSGISEGVKGLPIISKPFQLEELRERIHHMTELAKA